jgi:hypothetical protein
MDINKLKGFLGLADWKWAMTPAERLVVVGLLELLRPATALELGHLAGGCTAWLSRYCQEVFTCDIDRRVVASSKRFANVQALHMTSAKALALLKRQGRHLDLIVIDADHSFEGACRDLRGALPLADVILLHDSSNPTCRSGYQEALKDHDVYADLDLVEGHVQPDGLWGGLGVVLTQLPRSTPVFATPSEPTFHLLEKRWLETLGQGACPGR